MGNQLRKEYEIEDTPCGSGGFGLHWKIYNAKHLKTKQEVSIFILNKKSLPIRKNPYYDIFRRDITTATQCKHNDILKILSNDTSKLESSSQLAFVSERIIGSLSNFINNDISSDKPRLNLGELRIKLGITQLLSAVEYLHSFKDNNNGDTLNPMIHGFIDLCNIYISKNGDWKLMGFSFTHDALNKINNGEPHMDFTLGSYRNEKRLPYLPPYTCLAPEIYTNATIDLKSDVFSICRVIYFVYLYHKNKIESVPGCFLSTMSDYQIFLKDIGGSGAVHYKSFIDDPAVVHLLDIGLVKDMDQRGELKHLLKTQVTQDVNVKVIRYLDELHHKSTDKKLSFISKLSEAVATFSYDIIKDKLIPNLIRELKSNTHELQEPVLSLIFQLLHIHIEPIHFQTMVFPHLIQFFEIKETEAMFQVMVKNIGIITKYCDHKQRVLVANLYAKCLDLRFVIPMQKLVLNELATAIQNKLFDKDTLGRVLFRALNDICHEKGCNEQLQWLTSLRINTLICYSKICHTFTGTEMVQFVLEPMKYLVSVSSHSPAILMSTLGVYQCIVKAQNTAADASYIRVIALHLMPMITHIYINPILKPKQYKFCVRLIRQMIDCLEAYKQSKEDHTMVNGDTRGSTVLDAPISEAKQLPQDEIAIMEIEVKQSHEEDEDSGTKQDITPFPDKENTFFSQNTIEQDVTPMQSKQEKEEDNPFVMGNTDTNWMDFGGDTMRTDDITQTKTDDDHEKPPDIFGNTEKKDEDWTGFGHFSVDVTAWGSMSVDKGKFEDFDFGASGQQMSAEVIKENTEVQVDTETADVDNPFDTEDDHEDGAENNANNPFAFNSMSSFDNENVNSSVDITKGKTDTDGYEDPFKDLFG